jgi:integrase/recombinase XerD
VTEIERRNRALVAFALLTGARDGALATLRLKHLDLAAGSVYQDARDVATKFSKSFTTYFFPVGGETRQIFDDWVNYLRQEKLWGNDDPLFPATLIGLGESRQFEAVGLARRHWSTASPIRSIFQGAFLAAGLPYFNPHSFRNTLVQLGQTLCRDAEQFKAWSQNMGHDGVLTTFLSYGAVAPRRQGQIMLELASSPVPSRGEPGAAAKALVEAMKTVGLLPANA